MVNRGRGVKNSDVDFAKFPEHFSQFCFAVKLRELIPLFIRSVRLTIGEFLNTHCEKFATKDAFAKKNVIQPMQ